MSQQPRIAIDAMGGDEGVRVMIAGAALARHRHEGLRFSLFGDEVQIKAALDNHPNLRAASEVMHAPDVVTGTDKPSQAIRKKTSSMALAIQAVKEGRAGAAVSAGNTGALGAAYARTVLDLDRPRVRLLNIGTEEMKGTDEIRDAAALLRAATALPMQFDGFIEGDKISTGETDVVVTEGFAGNIALKTAEGTARFVTDVLRNAFTSSLRSKIGFLISKPAMHLLKHHLDPNNHNGAVFLGLNGVVVKSHGGASVKGVANAVHVAARLLEEDITRRIAEDLANIGALAETQARADASASAQSTEQPAK